jgi:hypothetical protein
MDNAVLPGSSKGEPSMHGVKELNRPAAHRKKQQQQGIERNILVSWLSYHCWGGITFVLFGVLPH